MGTISHNPFDLDALNRFNKDTMMEHLSIEYLEAAEGLIEAKMPVDHRTHQPMGLLHGGASAALAESVGSMGSALLVDLNHYHVVGAQITANHLKSVRSGWVYAHAVLIHRGKHTHVWNIDIKDETDQLISTCRLTNFIIKR